MKRSCRAVALVFALAPSALAADLSELEVAVQEAIKKAEPSVASILVSRSPQYRTFEPKLRDDKPGLLGSFPRFRGEMELNDPRQKLDMSHQDYTPETFGSGVVIDRNGLILTNAHVVKGAVKIFVRLAGGIESYADIHALDGRSDLAVLRLNERVPPLKPLAIGEGDNLKKGQFVVSLANPFSAGFRDGSPTASSGIVSNLRRRLVRLPGENDRRRLTLPQFSTLIMTDARLNVGCSGGALINLKGEMIGLTTAQASLVGIETPGGYALPMTIGVKRIVEVLREGKEVEYGFLGVQFSLNNTRGVQIGDVIQHSPAWQAGLRKNDLLMSVEGMRINEIDDVFVAVGTMLSGNTITVERISSEGGPREKVRVTLGKYHVLQPWLASNRPAAIGGLRVDHSSLVVQRVALPFQVIPEGVVIREVVPGSPAEKARLQPDKVISHVNGRKVTTPGQFYQAMNEANGDIELVLLKPEGGTEKVLLKLN